VTGQAVGAPLVALHPDDAREALLAVRLLDDFQADLQLCTDEKARLGLDLEHCRVAAAAAGASLSGADSGEGFQTPRPAELSWCEAAAWSLGGLAAGLAAGVALTLALGG